MRNFIAGIILVVMVAVLVILAMPMSADAAEAVVDKGFDLWGMCKNANEAIALTVASVVAVLGLVKFVLKVVSIWVGDQHTKAALEATVAEIDNLKASVDKVPGLSVEEPAKIITDGMARWETVAKPGAVAKLREAIAKSRAK